MCSDSVCGFRFRYQEKLDSMRAELERGVAAKELELKHRAAEIDSAARAKQVRAVALARFSRP